MAARKTKATPSAQSEPQAVEDSAFPYAVESPYRAGWEHDLTKKYGARGKTWTTTKSEPQWTARFRDSAAAAWFKTTWAAEASKE